LFAAEERVEVSQAEAGNPIEGAAFAWDSRGVTIPAHLLDDCRYYLESVYDYARAWWEEGGDEENHRTGEIVTDYLGEMRAATWLLGKVRDHSEGA
jgi:hypothetical protein